MNEPSFINVKMSKTHVKADKLCFISVNSCRPLVVIIIMFIIITFILEVNKDIKYIAKANLYFLDKYTYFY